VFTLVTYKLILCLTGTLERLDGKEEIIKAFAPVVDTVTLKECKVLLEVDLTEYNKLNSKFLNHFAFFNYDFGLAMSCLDRRTGQASNYANLLKCEYKEVMLHASQFSKAMRDRKDFVWKHPKKVEIANLIIENRLDKKIITFSQTKETASAIKYGGVIHSGQTKKKREQIMEEFGKAKTGVLNSAKILERGADIPYLSTSVTVSFNSSKIAKTQKSGRVTRKENEKESELFTLILKGTIEEEWFKNSSRGSNIVTITEQELVDVLNGIEKGKEIEEKQMMFRF
jgi:superfamily II DNA or RNA helicase